MKLVLVTPDLDKEMRVEVDVSDFAIGEVLLMKCEDGKWRSVAYISKLLNKAKRNYEIHNMIVSNYQMFRGMEAFLKRSQGSV